MPLEFAPLNAPAQQRADGNLERRSSLLEAIRNRNQPKARLITLTTKPC